MARHFGCQRFCCQPRRARGYKRGPHALCYRCDIWADDVTGICPNCDSREHVAPCVVEWCGRCRPELEPGGAVALARWFGDYGVCTFPIKPGTKEPDTNGRSWKGWRGPIPGRAYGVELGTLLVVDGDSPEAQDAIARFMPPTPFVVTTGPYHDRPIADGRGAHHYYRNPFGKRPSFIHRLSLPIESRNHGQYVVGPGSLHPSGVTYEPANWSWRWDDIPVLPEDFPFDDGTAPKAAIDGHFEMPDVVLAGQRTDMLFRLVRSLKAQGHTKADVEMMVRNANLMYCKPPRPASWFPAWFARAWNRPDRADFIKERVYVDAPTAPDDEILDVEDDPDAGVIDVDDDPDADVPVVEEA